METLSRQPYTAVSGERFRFIPDSVLFIPTKVATAGHGEVPPADVEVRGDEVSHLSNQRRALPLGGLVIMRFWALDSVTDAAVVYT